MNIFIYFRDVLFCSAQKTYCEVLNRNDVKIEFPRNPRYGDVSSNIALVIAKKLKIDPIVVAEKLSSQFYNNKYILKLSVEGTGFLNLTLKREFWYFFLKSLIKEGMNYPKINIGNSNRVNVEFVSANPTGALHLGHAKGAIFGDVIANLLSKCGFAVTKEFYINDAGKQVDYLVRSLEIRFKQLSGEKIELDQSCYPGEEIITLAKVLKDQYQNKFTSLDEIKKEICLKDFATTEMLNIIKKNLRSLRVYHHNFISEKSLIQKNKVQYCIDFLKSKNLLYKGMLEKPKSRERSNNWEIKEHILFKSTKFGDDIDRVVVKSNGDYTYFAFDIAYHFDKIKRGFNNIVLLLGADHIGYKKRLQSSVSALSDGNAKCTVKICQLVKLLNNGIQTRMSKRSGNFIRLSEVLDEIGSDALRFAILSKSLDTVLEIDINKLQDQTKDNPIFYVQYASARANSILNKAKCLGLDISDIIKTDVDLSRLDTKYDLELIKLLALYPKVLISCLHNLEPHQISYYLYNLACKFHQIWSKGTKEQNIKFIVDNDIKLTKSRIVLVYAIKSVIVSGLKLLGIEAVKQM